MWGKHFASMYEGSMRGAGPEFFSVWGYVISHMIPNRNHGTTVDLNPGIIAFLIGMSEKEVAEKIATMCQPDPKSRTKDEDGRKLVQISEYTYRVVNGDTYRKIRNEQDRREYQRVKQAEYRKKKKPKPTLPPPGEARALDALERGDEASYNQAVEDHLPESSGETAATIPPVEFPEQ